MFGREITQNLIEIDESIPGLKVTGYIGKPLISRGNRNYENYYINGRYVKSGIIAKGIEDAYKDFTMQHKYPFTVLHFTMDGSDLDVNVHPTKMELRFSRQQDVYNFVYQAVKNALNHKELIPRVELPEAKLVPKTTITPVEKPVVVPVVTPKVETKAVTKVEPVVNKPVAPTVKPDVVEKEENKNLDYFMKKMKERVASYHNQNSQAEVKSVTGVHRQTEKAQMDRIKESVNYRKTQEEKVPVTPVVKETPEKTEQLNLFEEKLLTKESVKQHKIIGQVFDTYWLVQFNDELFIIDQHAAHERVLYEKTLHGMKEREFTSQYLSPPIILNLSMQEEEVLNNHMDTFTKIGFEIEAFGGDSYAIRAVPDNLFSIAKKELLIEMLDNMVDGITSNEAPDILAEKVASMSCKAAVKGNARLSASEMETLIGELLKLENPYHCPHGRPTIIAMSKKELEKKFKRIV